MSCRYIICCVNFANVKSLTIGGVVCVCLCVSVSSDDIAAYKNVED